MSKLVFFPTERYGAVTRTTEQPHAVERLASWLRKAAHIRASASLGCEVALELAPNIVPIRHRTKSDEMAAVVTDYCHRKGYPGHVVSECIRVGLMRIRDGKSVASAIQSAKARADFAQAFGPKVVA